MWSSGTCLERIVMSDEFWGRRFFYMTTDHRMLVITVPPDTGNPYDNQLGKVDPAGYTSLPAIVDILDRTGTRLNQDAIIPIALAHEAAAYALGVGSDVLRLVAREKVGLTASTGGGATLSEASAG
jgi:hypothetical protein